MPIGGNSADLQVMVERKLREMERDPVKQDLQCTERSSEVQFAYEKFQVTELELQEQLEIAKAEICSLGEKLEQQRLSEEKLMQSLSNAEERFQNLHLKITS